MSLEHIGQTKDGVLPNITGEFNTRGAYSASAAYGAFNINVSLNDADQEYGGSAWRGTYQFSASRCSSLYNNNDWYNGTKVIPSCIAMYYIIKY